MGSYWFSDMGTLNAGSFVELKMDMSANVRIMTQDAFEKYKLKDDHQYIGGYVKFTPYTVKIPGTAHWFIVVDRGGREGKVSATVSVYQREKKRREKQIMLPED